MFHMFTSQFSMLSELYMCLAAVQANAYTDISGNKLTKLNAISMVHHWFCDQFSKTVGTAENRLPHV